MSAMTTSQVDALFGLPFNDLLYRAHVVHRQNFDPNSIQVSTLLSIKTGGCSEDCGYCSQAARYHTGVESQPLMSLDEVTEAARAAKARGATRFCMGAAWRGPKQRDLDPVLDMVRAVRSLGLETCVTLGMLHDDQAQQLAEAGLDYYNHNIDTAPEFYTEVIHTHQWQDRIDTLELVRQAGIKVCSGGIVGMGERRADRAGLIAQLATLDPQPESVPINLLVRIPGTPLSDTPALDPIEFVRTVAVARLALTRSFIRLSAGRREMPEELQALCFFAGANSIFYGDRLLTTPNPQTDQDQSLFNKLGLRPMPPEPQGGFGTRGI
ncbi:MAG: biotin synthase BioB [Gammaproteobacteria bacterium]|nr:biotin synthase BioB [Gammaproteobacteria bacterium]